MINTDFYKWFDKFSPKLQIRKDAFYKIFNYLDKMPDPIIIVETGCLRITNNFLDGQTPYYLINTHNSEKIRQKF